MGTLVVKRLNALSCDDELMYFEYIEQCKFLCPDFEVSTNISIKFKFLISIDTVFNRLFLRIAFRSVFRALSNISD